jgi:hypothetical protein
MKAGPTSPNSRPTSPQADKTGWYQPVMTVRKITDFTVGDRIVAATYEISYLLEGGAARAEPDSEWAYSLWLDAVIASRTAGREILQSVVAVSGGILARAGRDESPSSLLSQLERIDAQFSA